MEDINILYIDDNIDPYVSKYLKNGLNIADINKAYTEFTFTDEETYESLLGKNEVKIADLIIIDSKLFENNKVKKQKLKGEEFKLILRKFFPYKEVVVITQNKIPEEYKVLPKYNSENYSNSDRFFDKNWVPTIKTAIKNIIDYKNIANIFQNNKNIEKNLIEKIINTLDGSNEYDLLKSTDITKLIRIFKELEEKYNE